MSIYRQATLGPPDNMVTFNNFTTSPVFRVQSRAPRQFQTRDDNIPIPFESGVSDYITLMGQALYVIQGTMYPGNEEEYDSGMAALRAACYLDSQQSDAYNTDDGYIPYTWGEANSNKTLYVKALYVQMTETTQQGFVQPFIIYCKVKDPVIWGATLKTASTAVAEPVTGSSTSLVPFKVPVLLGATTYTVSADAINNGTIAGYPNSIDVYGPVTNPQITNTKNGEYILVNTTLSSSSDHLHIMYDKDSLVVTLNGNSVMNKIDSATTYFKIYPGDNIITLSGSSVGSGAYATVNYRDAFALG